MNTPRQVRRLNMFLLEPGARRQFMTELAAVRKARAKWGILYNPLTGIRKAVNSRLVRYGLPELRVYEVKGGVTCSLGLFNVRLNEELMFDFLKGSGAHFIKQLTHYLMHHYQTMVMLRYLRYELFAVRWVTADTLSQRWEERTGKGHLSPAMVSLVLQDLHELSSDESEQARDWIAWRFKENQADLGLLCARVLISQAGHPEAPEFESKLANQFCAYATNDGWYIRFRDNPATPADMLRAMDLARTNPEALSVDTLYDDVLRWTERFWLHYWRVFYRCTYEREADAISAKCLKEFKLACQTW